MEGWAYHEIVHACSSWQYQCSPCADVCVLLVLFSVFREQYLQALIRWLDLDESVMPVMRAFLSGLGFEGSDTFLSILQAEPLLAKGTIPILQVFGILIEDEMTLKYNSPCSLVKFGSQECTVNLSTYSIVFIFTHHCIPDQLWFSVTGFGVFFCQRR